ncbi:MAG: hypothetical protein ABIO60_07580, partial [Aquaticitalea sp.]
SRILFSVFHLGQTRKANLLFGFFIPAPDCRQAVKQESHDWNDELYIYQVYKEKLIFTANCRMKTANFFLSSQSRLFGEKINRQ